MAYTFRYQSIIKSGQELKARTEAEAIEGYCLLAGLLTIAPSVCFLIQPRNTGKGSITHSGLGPLSLQSLTKKVTCPHINLMEVFFSAESLFPRDPSLGQIDKNLTSTYF